MANSNMPPDWSKMLDALREPMPTASKTLFDQLMHQQAESRVMRKERALGMAYTNNTYVEGPNLTATEIRMRMEHSGSVSPRHPVREYEDASDKQVAVAALAGYTTERGEPGGIYPWAAKKPDNQTIGLYLTEREAWSACYYDLKARHLP